MFCFKYSPNQSAYFCIVDVTVTVFGKGVAHFKVILASPLENLFMVQTPFLNSLSDTDCSTLFNWVFVSFKLI